MRTQLITSMLSVVSTNINRKNANGRLFELGRLYLSEEFPPKVQPEERQALSLGLFGEGEDFFTLKGIVEAIMELMGAQVDYERSDEPYLHPGRQAKVLLGDEVIAVLGEVHPKTAEAMGISERVYVAEIQLPPLFAVDKALTIYRPDFYEQRPLRHTRSIQYIAFVHTLKLQVLYFLHSQDIREYVLKYFYFHQQKYILPILFFHLDE